MSQTSSWFNDVAFVGTYDCNTDCDYCFSERYVAPYKAIHMSLEDFQSTLDRIQAHGVNSIAFIWGEPALWKHISESIEYAKSKWITTTVFSNAMIPITAAPDVFYIHLNVLFLTQHKNILRNIVEYQKHSKIVFIYNVYQPTKFTLPLLLKILESFTFDFAMSFNIVFDDQIDQSYGEFLCEAHNYITKKMWKQVMSSGPLPHCIFTDPQIQYLQQHGILQNASGPANFENSDVFFTIVNPDTKTLLPCAPINLHLDAKYLLDGDKQGYEQAYSKMFAPHTQTPSNFCEGCEKFNTTCQYGSLINLYQAK